MTEIAETPLPGFPAEAHVTRGSPARGLVSQDTPSSLSPGTSLPGAAEAISAAPSFFLEGVAADHERLDALEARMLAKLPVVHLPVTHTFTPQLYCRRIHMPAGSLLTSKLHETTHQFAVLRGIALVSIPGQEPVRLVAGHLGVTYAGTRRALFIEEDCDWATWHPLTEKEEEVRAAGASERELVALVESRIIGHRERADGRDVQAEYRQKLATAGLPGPHEGAPRLTEGSQ